MRLRTLVPVLVTAAAACGQPDSAIETELLRADSAFARETAEGGAEAWTRWFDTTGTMVRPTGDVRGLAEIRAAMEPAFSDPSTRLSWSPDWAIAGSGDLGVTVGSYEVLDSAGVTLDHGRYLTVWRRQEDGGWKVIADIGSAAESESAESPPDGG